MAKIELELGDELSERLRRVADKVALSPSETAKMLLAQQLASERKIDWLALINRGREFLARIIQEARQG
ncbi:unnamed protein product [marine sediment metagenome]|uniref:Ribbon-helix-helix protein CopG domain-containing protein n=1 Tax=marine sediment metagenome TaxID=412755 RepID=X1V075_9ZZZZ